MSWEWVAPIATAAAGIAGVFFTWLTGSQGRKQVESMARGARRQQANDQIRDERRAAYIGALRIFRSYLALAEQKRFVGRTDGATSDEPADRIETAIEASILVEIFGSEETRHYMQVWIDGKGDLTLRRDTYGKFLAAVRRELGSDSVLADEVGSETT